MRGRTPPSRGRRSAGNPDKAYVRRGAAVDTDELQDAPSLPSLPSTAGLVEEAETKPKAAVMSSQSPPTPAPSRAKATIPAPASSARGVSSPPVCQRQNHSEPAEARQQQQQQQPQGLAAANAQQQSTQPALAKAGPPPCKGKGKGPPAPPGKAPPPKAPAAAARPRAQSQGPWLSGRRLQWRELGGADARNSIFDGQEGLTDSYDWSEVTQLFGSQGHRQSRNSRSPCSGDHGATVLTQRQATCCGVVAQKVGDVGALCARLRALDTVAEDDILRLQELLDLVDAQQGSEMVKLAAKTGPAKTGPAAGGGHQLRILERQLVPLFQLDRARTRLRLAWAGVTIEAQCNNFCDEARSVALAAESACKSAALKDLIRAAMSLRNYVQHGPEALETPIRVMDIGSLLSSMREFKGADAGARHMNLLTFFASTLLVMRPEFDKRLDEQLPDLAIAARTSWQGLRDSFAQLKADAACAEGELRDHSAAYGPTGSVELERLVTLATKCGVMVVTATQAMRSMISALEELGRYFGIPRCEASAPGSEQIPAKAPPGLAVLGHLAELLLGFRRACTEARGQQQREVPMAE